MLPLTRYEPSCSCSVICDCRHGQLLIPFVLYVKMKIQCTGVNSQSAYNKLEKYSNTTVCFSKPVPPPLLAYLLCVERCHCCGNFQLCDKSITTFAERCLETLTKWTGVIIIPLNPPGPMYSQGRMEEFELCSFLKFQLYSLQVLDATLQAMAGERKFRIMKHLGCKLEGQIVGMRNVRLRKNIAGRRIKIT